MRVTKAPQERRAELIVAARALFDEKGVGNTRVSDIVRRVGVAQGVFYYYFASKDEMVKVVMKQVAAEVDADAEAILSDTASDYCHKVSGIIELFVALVDKFLGDDETSLGPLNNTAAGHLAPAPEVMARLRTHLARLIEMGVAGGEITAAYPHETAEVLVCGLRGLAERQLPGRRLIHAVVEQALGLPAGCLVRYAE